MITVADGPLGTQALDVAEAIPTVTVYFVQRGADTFVAVVPRGMEHAGP